MQCSQVCSKNELYILMLLAWHTKYLCQQWSLDWCQGFISTLQFCFFCFPKAYRIQNAVCVVLIFCCIFQNSAAHVTWSSIGYMWVSFTADRRLAQLPFQLPDSAKCRLMTMSISEAPDETANFISSNRASSGVCPAGKPVATTVQQPQNSVRCEDNEFSLAMAKLD